MKIKATGKVLGCYQDGIKSFLRLSIDKSTVIDIPISTEQFYAAPLNGTAEIIVNIDKPE